MSKFKVGDKFKVVFSESKSDDLAEGFVHTLVEVKPQVLENNTQFYLTDTEWYMEETEVPNNLIIAGLSKILAVLTKLEEPDT